MGAGRPLIAAFMVVVVGVVAIEVASAGHNYVGDRWYALPISVKSGNNTGTCFQSRLSASTAPGTDSWNYFTHSSFSYDGVSTGNGYGSMFYGAIDGPGFTLGATFASVNASHQVQNVYTRIDNAESWYCGTGDAPSSQPDLWSVLAHEAGHWLVLGDLLDSDPACPDSVARATECGSIIRGTERQRTPNTTEDINSANTAYPTEGSPCGRRAIIC